MATSKSVTIGAGVGASLMALVISTATPVVTKFEGTKEVPYKDIAGVLTVCSGHTGPDVIPLHVYTTDECTTMTNEDVQKASVGVLKTSPQLIYHPMQLAALISFSYNVGVDGYAKSSVARSMNTGNFTAGCSELMKYVYAGGKYSTGLYNRRKVEYNICTSTLTPKGLANVGISSPTPSDR